MNAPSHSEAFGRPLDLSGRRPSPSYNCICDYSTEVAVLSSEQLGWKSIQLNLTQEPANEIFVPKTLTNFLSLSLTGTRIHRSKFAGIVDDTPSRPDDVMRLPAGIDAELCWETDGPFARSIHVCFGNDLFERYCPEIISGKFLAGHLKPQNYAATPELSGLIRILARELDFRTRRGKLLMETATRLLAMELANSHWSHSPMRAAQSLAPDPRIQRAVDYIEAHFTEDISLHDLSREAGLSSGHLISLFSHFTGRTPHSYLIDRRIQRAIELLKSTETPISAIAIETGFSDQQHMTRMFSNRLRRTPASFRKNGTRA